MGEQELLDFSLAWDRAIVSNDVVRIRSFMSSDWICVATHGGITDADDFLTKIKEGRLIHAEMSTEENMKPPEYVSSMCFCTRSQSMLRRIE